ncbi:MAG: TrkH family potassium uptake protein [Hyphomicrobiaceae bacterium]|nr:TrkH family potassium uptake protein [Hyphomicrobiaceae bacterium]
MPSATNNGAALLQLRPIVFTLGLLLCAVAAAMAVPAIVDVADGNDHWRVFFASAVLTVFIGGLMVLASMSHEPFKVGIKEGFVLTTFSWLATAAFAAVPFIGVGLSYTDAFFEAMSGLTTTGSTVIVGLDQLPRGLLLWRALLQAIGGFGIVITAIIILPFLRVGGMQLFQTERPDRAEKVLPRAGELVTAAAGIYLTLLVACTAAYTAFGMTLFDAVCHALTTVSTAGFSTHDQSFEFFASPSIEVTAIVFMILGALPFVMFIRVAHGDLRAPWRDAQVRGLLMFLAVVVLLMTVWLSSARDIAVIDALRLTAFNVTSIVTTTGFYSTDFTQWGTFAFGMFFILMFVGGCSGSTAGAIKIYRLQVAGMLTRSYLLHLISPNRVITLVYNGRRLPEDVPFSVIAFLAIYMATIGVFTVVLSALGIDFVTALTTSTSAVSTIGPALGEFAGPAGNYSALPAAAKWALSVAMLLGRLELFTVLVLFRPEFWR